MPSSSKHLLRALDGLADSKNLDQSIACCLKAVSTLVDADYYSCGVSLPHGETRLYHLGEGLLPGEHSLIRSFAELETSGGGVGNHPIIQANIGKSHTSVFFRSQLLPFDTWEKTPCYQLVDRRLGIQDMVSAFLPIPAGALYINCGRKKNFAKEDAKTLFALLGLLSPKLIQGLYQITTPPVKNSLPAPLPLTKRELEISHWLAQGKRNADIAIILGISTHTVRKHLENIYAKLGTDSRLSTVRTCSELQGPPNVYSKTG